MYEIECGGLSFGSLFKLNLIGSICFFVVICFVVGIGHYFEHYAIEYIRIHIQSIEALFRTFVLSIIFLFFVALANTVFIWFGLFVFRAFKKLKISIL